MLKEIETLNETLKLWGKYGGYQCKLVVISPKFDQDFEYIGTLDLWQIGRPICASTPHVYTLDFFYF
jgi:hypothetical protein